MKVQIQRSSAAEEGAVSFSRVLSKGAWGLGNVQRGVDDN